MLGNVKKLANKVSIDYCYAKQLAWFVSTFEWGVQYIGYPLVLFLGCQR